MSATIRRIVEDAGELCENSGDIQIQWIVKDVQSIVEGDTCYKSRCFYVAGIKLRVAAWPYHSEKSGRGICVYVRPEDACASPKSVDGTLHFKKADGTDLRKLELISGVIVNNLPSVIASFLFKSDLESVEVLTVTCIVRVNEEADSTARLDTLSDDLRDLFLTQKTSDVKLIVNHEEIPAHRSVLSARSPVFANMFEVDMKEKKTGVVDIPHFPAEPFRDFLLYLYSGKVDNLSRNAVDVYRIADEYNVPPLKKACVRSLINNLSLDNVFDALLLADLFGETALKTLIQKFFNMNSEKIFHSSEWKSFFGQNFELCNDLLKGMSAGAGNT